MQIATSQSLSIFLYFALSCADELLKIILIPIYNKTDNNPTRARFLNATYH